MRRIKFFGLLVVLVSMLISGCSPKAVPATQSKTEEAATPKIAQSKEGWELEWDKLLAAAKKEGKVVVYSGLVSESHRVLSQTFKEKFGITAEFVAGTPSETARKVISERQGGIYLGDVHLGGTVIVLVMIAPTGAFDSLDEALILPEVKDPKAWMDRGR